MGNENEFEGLRPKNAVCTSCDYLFGGLPIKGGVIICPECGHAQTFKLPEIGPPCARFDAKPALYRTLLCAGIGIVATLVGLPVQSAAAVALILILFTVPIALWRAWTTWRTANRRWLEHRKQKRDAT